VPGGETLASNDQRKKVGDLITGFEKYLQDNAPAHPALAPAITELRTAVAAYRSPQAGDPAAAIRRVLATIQAARKLDTLIPEP
jgi:hypothetical protein